MAEANPPKLYHRSQDKASNKSASEKRRKNMEGTEERILGKGNVPRRKRHRTRNFQEISDKNRIPRPRPFQQGSNQVLGPARR